MNRRFVRALAILLPVVAISAALAIWMGSRRMDLDALRSDPFARMLFFRLRLPRVAMAALIGATLALIGRRFAGVVPQPPGRPVHAGRLGWRRVGRQHRHRAGLGRPRFGCSCGFLASFAGACRSRAGSSDRPQRRDHHAGSAAAVGRRLESDRSRRRVLTIQYLADPTRALHILRWMIGSLDVVGFQYDRADADFPGSRPGSPCCCSPADLHLLAMDEDTAATLGVNVRRCEIVGTRFVLVDRRCDGGGGRRHRLCGTDRSAHSVRLLFGEDLRIVLPASFLLGAAFLVPRTLSPGPSCLRPSCPWAR